MCSDGQYFRMNKKASSRLNRYPNVMTIRRVVCFEKFHSSHKICSSLNCMNGVEIIKSTCLHLQLYLLFSVAMYIAVILHSKFSFLLSSIGTFFFFFFFFQIVFFFFILIALNTKITLCCALFTVR